MRRIALLLILFIYALALLGFESGKFIHKPYASLHDLYVSDGIMISEEYAMPGFSADTGTFFCSAPIFSYTRYKNGHIIGTGMNPFIYNVSNSDTLALFADGETVYQLAADDKKGIFAAIIPSGIVIRIDEKGMDTLGVFPERGINLLKKSGSSIFLAIENELYSIENDEIKRVCTVNDKNIAAVEKYGNTIVIGTEGKGKLIELNNGRQEVIYTSMLGEIDLITKNAGMYRVLLNTKNSDNGNELMYTSSILDIGNNAVDTLYSTAGFIIGGVEMNGNIIMMRAQYPELLLFRDKQMFSMGIIKSDYMLSIGRYGNEIIITTGDPGRLYTLNPSDEVFEYESNVIDMGKNVKVNSLHVNAEGKGKLYFRQGDSYDVNDSWSAYMLIRPGMALTGDMHRFVQYRYVFSDRDNKLYDVSMYYKTINHAPQFDSLKVYTPRILPDYVLPEGINVYPVFNTAMYPEYEGNIMKTSQKVIFCSWSALDRDNDMLIYNVYMKNRYGYLPVKKGIKEQYALIYADGFDQGEYELVVEASDSLSNTDNGLTASISRMVYIDNTPPVITDARYEKNVLTFRASDGNSFIDEMYYSVNGSEMKTVMPDDGIYDSNEESFTVNIKKEVNEDMLIAVYVLDRFGNIARETKFIR